MFQQLELHLAGMNLVTMVSQPSQRRHFRLLSMQVPHVNTDAGFRPTDKNESFANESSPC
jgi:hypothetical protein